MKPRGRRLNSMAFYIYIYIYMIPEWIFWGYIFLLLNELSECMTKVSKQIYCWMFCRCILDFYGISACVGYLMPNPFLYIQTVLFQTIHFSISTHFCSIWPMDRTLSRVTTLGQCGPESNGKKELFHISQSSRITWASPSDYLVSYLGHSLGGGLIHLQRCIRCILQSQPTASLRFVIMSILIFILSGL